MKHIDRCEQILHLEYIDYCKMLYALERDDGIDLGEWPPFEEWLIWKEEEAKTAYNY